MKVDLKYKPKNPIIIEGFPGFGLVGTISTEFLIKHLNAKKIGSIWSENMIPFATVHDSKIVDPVGVYYDKKNNIVIIHSMSPVKGLEWKIANVILDLAKKWNAKEIISIEAIGSREQNSIKSYFYSNKENTKKRFEIIGLQPLKEGMIVGVTGALLLGDSNKVSSIFVESHISIGDSKAAAQVIKILDDYLGLKIDYKPLLRTAQNFEDTLKKLINKSKKIKLNKERREDLNYLG
jgi:uncharacterized protein